MKIPPSIKIKNQEYTFQDFIINNILLDPQFGKDLDSLLLAGEIKEALEEQDLPGQEWKISKEALILLQETVKHPSHGYKPELAIHFIPFLKVILAGEQETK